MTATVEQGFSIRVSEDGLAAFLSCNAPVERLHSVAEAIARELAAMHIAYEGTEDEILVFLGQQTAKMGPELHDVLLCEGNAPVQPVDGRIEWAGNFFDSGFVVDPETGAIDYRQHSAERSVTTGQLLATMIPPVPGQDGVDVFGRRLKVRAPSAPRLYVGENIQYVPEDQTFLASAEGRIRLDRDVLSVDKVFRIDGDVGLETGNIDHLGAVEIHKDVQAGATVKSTGDIEVMQLIEAANIECGGSLVVRGGIMGSGPNSIRVSGSIHARFILDADIQAGGDIVVEREIVHSKLRTRGAILMPRGRLIGGDTVALHGARIGTSGSTASVPTPIVVGVDYTLAGKLKQIDEEIEPLEKSRAKIQASLKPFAGKAKNLPPKQQQAITKLAQQANELKQRIEELHEQAEQLKEEAHEEARMEVQVRDRVFPETIIYLGAECRRIHEEFLGPVSMKIHAGRVEVLSVS